MTFEEGLEKLKERHEALAQSVELLLRSQQESQQKFDSRFERLLAIVEHLVETAQNHERRLTKLED